MKYLQFLTSFMLVFLAALGHDLIFLQQPPSFGCVKSPEAKGSMFKLCQVRLPARGSQKGMLNFLWPWRFLGVPPVFLGSETNTFGFQTLFKWWICVFGCCCRMALRFGFSFMLTWRSRTIGTFLSDASAFGLTKNMLDKILQGYLAMHLLDVDWNVSQKCWPSSPQLW